MICQFYPIILAWYHVLFIISTTDAIWNYIERATQKIHFAKIKVQMKSMIVFFFSSFNFGGSYMYIYKLYIYACMYVSYYHMVESHHICLEYNPYINICDYLSLSLSQSLSLSIHRCMQSTYHLGWFMPIKMVILGWFMGQPIGWNHIPTRDRGCTRGGRSTGPSQTGAASGGSGHWRKKCRRFSIYGGFMGFHQWTWWQSGDSWWMTCRITPFSVTAWCSGWVHRALTYDHRGYDHQLPRLMILQADHYDP